MFSRLPDLCKAAMLCGVLVLPACAGGASSVAPLGSSTGPLVHTSSHGGQGGGGGGPNQIPPPPQIDGPAWYLWNASASQGPPSPNVDFDAIKNTVQGAIPIGSSITATEIVYNISKKTPLTITKLAIVGPNASDFTIPAAEVQSALQNPVPANKGQGDVLQITFTPSAQGPRTATLRLVSNAGTALVSLSGTALPPYPILVVDMSPLNFLPTSAPDSLIVSNSGGAALVLGSIAFGGANPGSFTFFAANHGQGNCFNGDYIGPHSYCFIGVGPASGAPVPSKAFLAIDSNDPSRPEIDIPLSLTQQ